MKIKLEDDRGDFTIKVGKLTEGSTRFAQKEGSDVIYTIPLSRADWATADQSMFEKKHPSGCKGD